jgi:D-alanine-D-alanine ligase
MTLGPHGFIPVVHAATEERPDEIDTLIAAEAVALALAELGFLTDIVPVGLEASEFEDLKGRSPSLVFNLVDAVKGDGRLAPEVPAMLDKAGLPYTGADVNAWRGTLSKLETKKKLAAEGLATPRWSSDGQGFDADALVIVKPVWEHGSLGLDDGSVVKAAEAAALVAERERHFGTAHFAEAYVEGREFNLALLQDHRGIRALPMAEILFEQWGELRPRIVGYDAKWSPESKAYAATPRRFGLESKEPELAAKLKELALDCWRLFGLSGYARVDFRVDGDGRPWILEVNVNPCLTPDAGFAAAAFQAGLSYDGLIGEIVEAVPTGLQAHA